MLVGFLHGFMKVLPGEAGNASEGFIILMDHDSKLDEEGEDRSAVRERGRCERSQGDGKVVARGLRRGTGWARQGGLTESCVGSKGPTVAQDGSW